MSLLKRLTNLSIVSKVLVKPNAYPNVHSGFARDRQKLCKDCGRVSRQFNASIKAQYGKQKYAG